MLLALSKLTAMYKLALCISFGFVLRIEGVEWTGNANITITEGNLLGGHYVANDNVTVVTAFLGVPYAKPPLGNLRFRASEEREPGTGSIDARTLPPACMQHSPMAGNTTNNDTKQTMSISEDCLTLSIYIPRNISKPGLEALSVMVYFHDGGLQMGNGAWVGQSFAFLANVIVVSVNYRLNVFGFLSSEDAAAPGNFGLLDQQLALRWVNKNIAKFGGDPNSVTIFGMTAGAWSVAHHVTSPGSRGLFQRAICMSGTVEDDSLLQRNARDKVMALASHLNCTKSQTSDVIKCLRQVPAHELFAASEKQDVTSTFAKFMPVVDGVFLKEKPEESLRKGDLAPVDVLTGLTSFEGWKYLSMYGGISLTEDDQVLTKTKVLELFSAGDVLSLRNNSAAVKAALLSEYTPYEASDSEQAWTEALINATGDRVFVAPNSKFLQKIRQVTNNTYMYLFNHQPSFNLGNISRPEYVGASNGDDSKFVLGDVFAKKLGTVEEQAFSLRLAQLFGQFSRDGYPNVTDLEVKWDPYTGEDQAYLVLNPSNFHVANHFQPRRTAFWNTLLPAIEQTNRKPCEPKSHPVVQTKNGAVMGRRRSAAGYVREDFLGIPFAAPPVGDLRFRAPEEHGTWTGTLDAATFKPMCTQVMSMAMPFSPRPDAEIGAGKNMSEDCLYLNVVVPRNVQYARNKSLPVIVYIYGGGFVLGNAFELDGVLVAPYSDIIVVTFAHRLGVFGFFTTGDAASPGNYGLMDQQAALKWVHENIASFGGDPNLVTIQGHSAGSVGVLLHALNKDTQKYFKRAIAIAGTPLHKWANDDSGKSERFSKDFAKKVGCDSDSSVEIVKCMRDVGYDALAMNQTIGDFYYKIFPVVDGQFVKKSPEVLIEEGYGADVEILVGITSSESLMEAEFMLPTLLASPEKKTINLTAFEAAWQGSLMQKNIDISNDAVKRAIENEYFLTITDEISSAFPKLVQLLSDAETVSGSVKFLDLFSKSNGTSFFYVFSHSPSKAIAFNEPHMLPGSSHGDELGYVFGIPLLGVNYLLYTYPPMITEFPYTTEEKRLSEDVIEMMTNFAKTGDPSFGGLKFPTYNAEKRPYLDVSLESSVKSNPFPRRMALWNDLMPQLSQLSQPVCPTAEATTPHSVTKRDTEETGSFGVNMDTLEFITYVVIGVAGLLLLVVIAIAIAWCCAKPQEPKNRKRGATRPSHSFRLSTASDRL